MANKKLNEKGLLQVWTKLWTLLKQLIGDVDTSLGTLQEQITTNKGMLNKLTDDTTSATYKLGVDNGLIYIENADE